MLLFLLAIIEPVEAGLQVTLVPSTLFSLSYFYFVCWHSASSIHIYTPFSQSPFLFVISLNRGLTGRQQTHQRYRYNGETLAPSPFIRFLPLPFSSLPFSAFPSFTLLPLPAFFHIPSPMHHRAVLLPSFPTFLPSYSFSRIPSSSLPPTAPAP